MKLRTILTRCICSKVYNTLKLCAQGGGESGRCRHRDAYKLPLGNDNINMGEVFVLVGNPDIGCKVFTAESGGLMTGETRFPAQQRSNMSV